MNLGYVAAPAASVTETARSLGRKLNIGIVGVEDSVSAAIVEPARVTGAGEFSTGVEAIRFQARTHQLTAGSSPVKSLNIYQVYCWPHASGLATTGSEYLHSLGADNISSRSRGSLSV